MESSDTDPSWSAGDTDEEDLENKGAIRFGGVEVSKKLVKDAIEFYRSSEKGSRLLSSMTNRYRFITSEYHIKKLRRIEKSQEIRADRVIRLRALASKLKETIASKFELGIALHDTDIRAIALQINREEMCIENFKRVTTFISRRNFLNSDRLASQAEAFVNRVRRELRDWPAVCNADQSGFFKELHSSRTLAMRVVQSTAAITHSFTVMAMLFLDGKLGEKLYVEPQGCFSDRGHFVASNLEVRAHTSHIMNKPLLLDWMSSCVVPSGSTAVHLIVDSWSSFKDHDSMLSVVPVERQIEIMNMGLCEKTNCNDLFFIRCAHCEHLLRFNHFVIDFHHCV